MIWREPFYKEMTAGLLISLLFHIVMSTILIAMPSNTPSISTSTATLRIRVIPRLQQSIEAPAGKRRIEQIPYKLSSNSLKSNEAAPTNTTSPAEKSPEAIPSEDKSEVKLEFRASPIKIPKHLLGMGIFPRRYRITLEWVGGELQLVGFQSHSAPQKFVDDTLAKKIREILKSGSWDVSAIAQQYQEHQQSQLDIDFRE